MPITVPCAYSLCTTAGGVVGVRVSVRARVRAGAKG